MRTVVLAVAVGVIDPHLEGVAVAAPSIVDLRPIRRVGQEVEVGLSLRVGGAKELAPALKEAVGANTPTLIEVPTEFKPYR